ncbi:SIS domain-containing protein [Methylophilus sp. QUAN]|uniref:KpsF/GutQ family sugar-phosphate isomerase n=1 Tax=Methylophilus sp. QUAN TaxID=2781020 RepID=UPI00188EE008|nr:KpsF/GutQ family sugar-phosphate isomerase [Methylophilus sp. QUAN]MBF4991762.1 KpsF/GutQ family sugar-phosphate isomerase [Methylophilus sp. QUAN]
MNKLLPTAASESYILEIAQTVFNTEIESLQQIASELDAEFAKAVQLVLESSGRFIIIGMGKSGIIGKKIAATLASTGTASFYVHPGEAFHGDLGMIQPGDVTLLISNSGETEELIRIIPFLTWQKNKMIALTGNPQSTLARNAHAVLNIAVAKEACNNNLAPTSSTTATLVMGDALAVTLSTLKQFMPEDFARFHPGGSLGRKLLTKVHEVMRSKDLPICGSDASFRDVVSVMNQGRLGLAIIIDNDQLQGIITDGDLRRALNNFDNPILLKAAEFMTTSPKTINQDEMFSVAEEIMQVHKINSMVVLNEKRTVCGILQIYNF